GRAVEVLLIPCQGYEDKGFERFLIAEDGLKCAVSHLNLATVYSWTDRLDEAIQEAERAVELDRDQPYPCLVLGWLYYHKGDTAAATRCFRKAAGMEPTNEHYRQALDLANPYLSSKVGRNEPCPCGSGKKFKKCHGAEA
ncbi:MAG: SEC-C metal-binding domain-containing protein, partial [Candidatus Eremiobacterota bacterium]